MYKMNNKAGTKSRKKTRLGLPIGLSFAALFCIGLYVLTFNNDLHWLDSPGPINIGHEKLLCDECHQQAVGTLRQQLQANAQYLVGKRKSGAEIGHRKVANETCLHCHDRPKDRHPVYRFFEPRYAKARLEIQPQYCNSCHREHTGKRVTMEIGNCKVCHNKLKIKKDPLDISHQQLIKEKRWSTCLGCHDFHGNHKLKLSESLNVIYSEQKIKNYFNEAPSPYGKEKYYKAIKGKRYGSL